MRFDAADTATLDGRGVWDEVVPHRLSFGALQKPKGLMAPSGAGGHAGPVGMADHAVTGGVGPVPGEAGGAAGPFLGALASPSDLGYVLAPRAGQVVDTAVHA
jgi:hypothetical protein